MTRGLGVSALIGLLLIVVLVWFQDLGSVMQAIVAARWGIPIVVLLQLLAVWFAGMAWCVLVNGRGPDRVGAFVLARWIREGVNDLLPVAQIGGHLVGARILTFFGVDVGQAGGSIVVDVTLRLIAQLAFTSVGLSLLIGMGVADDTIRWIASGIVLSALGIAGFVFAQRWGLFRLLERGWAMMAKRWPALWLGAVPDVHASIEILYGRSSRLIAGAVLHSVALVVSACEVWVLLTAMQVPIAFHQALLIESLALAIKNLGFSIPGALGVQESGYMLVGAVVGIAPPLVLAVSLIKRLRDVMLGIPALAVWMAIEGGYLWGRAKEKEPA